MEMVKWETQKTPHFYKTLSSITSSISISKTLLYCSTLLHHSHPPFLKLDVPAILGWSSLIAWAFTEIPQILTNYVQKSASGIHLGFLVAWFVGDIFNVSGCIIEPATLLTQLYMAIRFDIDPELEGDIIPTDPILINSKDFYYMSARSLAVSPNPTPPSAFFFPSGNVVQDDTNGDSLNSTMDPSMDDSSSMTSNKSKTIKGYPPAISLLVYAGVGLYCIVRTNHLSHGFIKLAGEMLLANEESSSKVGTILVWAMAFAYISGRLLQVFLNNSNENRTGVNPFMFSLALFANTTYIASILFKSLEWSAISSNLPWIVDAGACVLLDLYILLQLYLLS